MAADARGALLQGDTARRDHLIRASQHINDGQLAKLVQTGCACHHGGLSVSDKRAIEMLFAEGALSVLCCTTGLAQGVNLPARLVVIMNTAMYSQAAGGYEEYSRIEVLQAAGRAGRPQFDTMGVCVVMTRPEVAHRYEGLLAGSESIESHMHKQDQLVRHLNAEIAAGYVTDVATAVTWLRSTFYYTRLKRNPEQYQQPGGLTESELEERLTSICMRDLRKLSTAAMITLGDDSTLRPQLLGSLMAKHCVDYSTVLAFPTLEGSAGLQEVLQLVAESTELAGDLYVRATEKKQLGEAR